MTELKPVITEFLVKVKFSEYEDEEKFKEDFEEVKENLENNIDITYGIGEATVLNVTNVTPKGTIKPSPHFVKKHDAVLAILPKKFFKHRCLHCGRDTAIKIQLSKNVTRTACYNCEAII